MYSKITKIVHNIPLSLTEAAFSKKQGFKSQATKIPYILVDSFPELGLLTALRFLEWVSENPKGIISLPTGKTPEYFIKWTHHLLTNWNDKKLTSMRNNYGLNLKEKPDLSCLTFVQIDEFYPINPKQHNSFNHYIKKYYLNGMGIPEEKAVLINCDQISLFKNKPWSEVFPDGLVDLSLRYKDPKSNTEKEQQRSIFLIDQWCSEYENKINNLGGIGFFLGGIGPDGHIAFNVRGSDHNSTTRLMETNFETQAAAATDLGGIEISKNRLVITIGLGTITTNKNAVAIITAAGEAKATIVKKSLENAPDVIYPASVLQTLKNSRFYLTKGAGKHLKDVENIYWKNAEWSESKKQRALLQLAHSSNTFGKKLTVTDLKNDPICKHIPNLNKIFTQNITIEPRERIIPLPIGIANSMWKHGDLNIWKQILENNSLVNKPNSIYFNFNINTNTIKRKKCYDVIRSKNIPNLPNTNYLNYLKMLSSYKFAICPEGNGLDTHRFWECLYLKVIPICLKNHITEYYSKNFPIVLLDDWNHIDENMLGSYYNNTCWDNYNMLNFDTYCKEVLQ